MKPICLIAVLALAGMMCGCGSIVKSTKETVLPKTSDPLTGIRYYLPKGRVQVSAEWKVLIPGWEPTIKPLVEADPSACYRIERNINALFDDDITIQVDPMTGLLQSTSGTSSDQSVAALANLAAGAANALTFGANLGAALASGGTRGPLTAEELAAERAEFAEVTSHAVSSTFSVIVDPRHPKQIYYLVEPDSGSRPGEAKGTKLYAKYVIELKRINEEPVQASGTSGAKTTLNGIVVRTPVPHYVTVTGTLYREGGHPMPQQPTTQVVFLPDDDHDYFLPISRIPLVTTSTKVTLVIGMVQTLQRSRPSLINAIAGVPKNILSALIPLPLAVQQSNVQVAGKGQSGQSSGGTTGTGSKTP